MKKVPYRRNLWGDRVLHHLPVVWDATLCCYRLPDIKGAMDTPLHTQSAFQFRDDDGSETAATFFGSVNDDVTVGSGETIELDTNFRYRIVVQETAGFADSNHRSDLQYSLNSGTWTDISATSLVVRAFTSTQYADGDDTTQQIGGGSFVTPNGGMDDGDGSAGGAALDFLGSDETELEFCLQIRAVDVSDSDTIDIKGTDKGTDYNSYTNIGRLTAVTSSPQTVTQTAGIVSGEVVPSPNVNFTIIQTAGIVSGEVVPSDLVVGLGISLAAGIVSGEVVPSDLVVAGPITIANGVATAEVVPSPQVNFIVSPTSIASGEVVPSPEVCEPVAFPYTFPLTFGEDTCGASSPQTVTLTAGIASGEVVPSDLIVAGPVTLAAGIATGEVVPSPQVNFTIVSPTSIVSGEVVPSDLSVDFTIVGTAGAIATGEVVPSPQVNFTIIIASGITSGEVVPSDLVVGMGISLAAGVATGEVVPSDLIVAGPVTLAAGVATGEVVPSPQVDFTIIVASGIVSAEVVPSDLVVAGSIFDAGAIASGEVVSTDAQVNFTIFPSSIVSGEVVPSDLSVNITITGTAGAIASGEVVPTDAQINFTIIQVNGVASAEVVPSDLVVGGAITGAGAIASEEVVPSDLIVTITGGPPTLLTVYTSQHHQAMAQLIRLR